MNKDINEKESLGIYLRCLEEAKYRLAFAERFAAQSIGHPRINIESACLQFRKALELIAYAAVAPHKTKYEAWRRKAEVPKDFRRDFNGKKILHSLAKLNPYSYPRPLLPPVERNGAKHFEPFRGEYLTKKDTRRHMIGAAQFCMQTTRGGITNSTQVSQVNFQPILGGHER